MDDVLFFTKHLSSKNLQLYCEQNKLNYKVDNDQKDSDRAENFCQFLHEKASSMQRAKVEYDFNRMRTLREKNGVSTLISTSNANKIQTPKSLFEDSTEFDQVFWFYYNHFELFKKAHIWYIAERKTGWREVYFPTGITIEEIKKAKDTFMNDFKTHLYEEERIAGNNCMIEVYEKDDRICFVAYPEGRAIENRYYEGDDLKRDGVIKEVKERYFVFNVKTGLLRIKMREYHKSMSMLSLFGISVLKKDLKEAHIKVLNLNRLKDEDLRFDYTHADGIKSVALRGISLLFKDSGNKMSITLSKARNHGVDELQSLARRYAFPIAKDYTDIIWTKIDFKFDPKMHDGVSKKTLNLTGDNLTELTDDPIDRKIRELLIGWKILIESDEKPN